MNQVYSSFYAVSLVSSILGIVPLFHVNLPHRKEVFWIDYAWKLLVHCSAIGGYMIVLLEFTYESVAVDGETFMTVLVARMNGVKCIMQLPMYLASVKHVREFLNTVRKIDYLLVTTPTFTSWGPPCAMVIMTIFMWSLPIYYETQYPILNKYNQWMSLTYDFYPLYIYYYYIKCVCDRYDIAMNQLNLKSLPTIAQVHVLLAHSVKTCSSLMNPTLTVMFWSCSIWILASTAVFVTQLLPLSLSYAFIFNQLFCILTLVIWSYFGSTVQLQNSRLKQKLVKLSINQLTEVQKLEALAFLGQFKRYTVEISSSLFTFDLKLLSSMSSLLVMYVITMTQFEPQLNAS